MTTFAAKTKNTETDSSKSNGALRKSNDFQADSINIPAPLFGFPIQRKASCACGGGCPGCQTKNSNLPISQPDDASEKEADAVADKVMRMPMPEPISFSSKKNPVSRKCDHCEEEEKQLQKKESSSNSITAAPSIVHEIVNSSSGKSLDAETRSYMEPRFNYDFGNVKIHDNSIAAKSADSINALAYTSGNNIVFNSGQYNTNSDSGKRLLAHELTHVVQQNNLIHPYRDPKKHKDTIHFGVADDSKLTEDSFDIKKDKETKPWIELITITLTSKITDRNGSNFWVGTGLAQYYNNPVKLADLSLSISAGSAEVGKTSAGNDFKVKRIEGIGYNSSKYSEKYEPAAKKGRGKRYSKDLRGNMNFAVVYHGEQALHSGPIDSSSHGCVHVDWTDETNMKQLNYHSVIGLTKVEVKYP